MNIIGTGGNLAGVAVRQCGIHKPLIQCQLSAVIGYEQHIVLRRTDHLVADSFSTVGQGCNQIFLVFRGLQYLMMVMSLRHRQLKHIRSLNVCDLLEHSHQFREIVETGKSCFGSVARAFRCKLDGSNGFTEGRCPGIEVKQAVVPQRIVLQVLLHGVHFHHGVADGGAGGEDNAASACDLIQIAAFHVKVTGFLGFCLADAADITHFRKCGQIFVVMCLVHEDAVDAQFFKGYEIVLAGLVIQLVQLCLDGFLRLFQLLDGELCSLIVLQFCDAVEDFL